MNFELTTIRVQIFDINDAFYSPPEPRAKAKQICSSIDDLIALSVVKHWWTSLFGPWGILWSPRKVSKGHVCFLVPNIHGSCTQLQVHKLYHFKASKRAVTICFMQTTIYIDHLESGF